MSSIFHGKTALRHRYDDLTAAELTSATNQATSVLLTDMKSVSAHLAFLDNTLNVDLALYLVHPEADASVAANRLFWLELPSARVINYSAFGSFHTFDPGTKIYVSVVSGSPSTGKLRIAYWG